MVHFRDISIRRKLLFINVLTTSTALVLVSTAFITHERFRFQDDVTRQLSTVADVIGTSARAALADHDRAGAEEVLRALAAEPRILAACLYDAQGGMRACYAREPGAEGVSQAAAGSLTASSHNGDLLLQRPILAHGQPLGSLWIRFDGRVSFETLRHDLSMVSLAMSVCFIIAVLLSTRLQRVITAPLTRLARTAREVAAGRDYSLRAEKSGEDELGRLVDSFNEMLSQLGEHAAELRSIYDSAHDAIITVTSEGAIASWNQGAEHIFGCAEGEVRGKALASFFTQASRAVYEKELSCLHRGGEASAGKLVEVAGLRPDDTEFPLELTIAKWRTKKGTFYTSFLRDTSARRMLEAQLAQAQKLESIGHLTAGVAHEINTPIQYLGDNTRFLDESFRNLDRVLRSYETLAGAAETSGLLAEEVKQARAAAEEADLEYLHGEIPRAIQQSGEGVERVATIVRAMKEFSHPGSAEMKAIDLNHAIESTLTVSRNEWKYVAEAVTEFDPNLPVVRCLPAEFNQVILNLVVNAAHAIADVSGRGTGKGQITISTRRDGEWAEIRVRDTGTGIPHAVRSRIFTPFFTTKEMGRGTGQGLAIAHAVVVTKHGGTLDFETEEGQGTTFIIRLPIEGCPPGRP
ncbi:MAG: PAS domain S-box protein [Acidobacteriia bacterium]|nr:PAS domain S-box protein [Terriglobia bacterium]